MVGIAGQVARDRMSLDQLKEIVNNRDWEGCVNTFTAPPQGLHMVEAQYPPELLADETDDLQQLPVGPEPEPHVLRPDIEWDKMDMKVVEIPPKPAYSHPAAINMLLTQEGLNAQLKQSVGQCADNEARRRNQETESKRKSEAAGVDGG